ncbi:hypothetical protein pb186bvf_020982 [Paramecium bursaria]
MQNKSFIKLKLRKLLKMIIVVILYSSITNFPDIIINPMKLLCLQYFIQIIVSSSKCNQNSKNFNCL